MPISFFVLLQYNNTTTQIIILQYNTIYYLRVAYPKYVFRIWLHTTIQHYILLACCLSQVCFQDMAALSCMQFANGFLLDLAHAFTG